MALGLALAMIAAGCDSGKGGSSTTPPTTPPDVSTADTTPGGGPATQDAPRLFGLRLSPGSATPSTGSPTELVAGDELPADRIAEITGRLPEWDDGAATRTPFAWPPQSVPPPRTGTTVDVPFPPAQATAPPEAATGPLHVLRVQPEGDVPIAPYLAITFDQPMVAVGTVGQVDASSVPVTLSPAIEGRWQWIGTRTLRFDATGAGVDRLPMATSLHVEVPAGTTSATGGVLAETRAFDVITPPPAVQALVPQGNSLPLEPTFIATFDQRIDSAAVLATIHLRAGQDDVALRLASPAEVASDDTVNAQAGQAGEGRWVAFRTVDPLPTDTALTIDVGPGTPSAEGPATTTEPATFTELHTYAPLRATELSCSWGPQCPPATPLAVQFNNELDADHVDLTAVRVDPVPAGMALTVRGNIIEISGDTQAQTAYSVTLPASITDVFGQTLGTKQTLTVTVGTAPPGLAPLPMVTTLDPFADGQKLSIVSTGHRRLRVRTFAADPATFAEFSDYYERRYDPAVDVPDWQVLGDDLVDIDGDVNRAQEVEIDLGQALQGKAGQAIVLVEPQPPSTNRYDDLGLLTWVQSTQLGIDATTSNSETLVWVTDLRTGAPRAGVDVSGGPGRAATDGDGLARLPSPDNGTPLVIVARAGVDTAVLPSFSSGMPATDVTRWHVFTDRGVYQPGETLRAKGWVRLLTLSSDAQLTSVPDGTTVHYTLMDAYGNQLADGSTALGRLGSFNFEVPIGAVANVGQAMLQMSIDGPNVGENSTVQTVQIAEYRRPEFEVVTNPRTPPPFLSTTPATIDATATYYSGGALAGAPVDWRVSTAEASYSPPGWDGFSFGVWHPWWIEQGSFLAASGAAVEGVPCCTPTDSTVEEFHGVTDAAGAHALQLEFEGKDGVLPDLPVSVTAEATVTDLNRQAWASRSTLLVHPADRYVGVRSARAFVRQGDAIDIDAVVTTIDGTIAPGVQVAMTAGRLESKYVDGAWSESLVAAQECTVTSTSDPVRCSFTTDIGGEYKVTAILTDAHGGRSRSELRVWVSGVQSQPNRGVEVQQLTLVPDHPEYAAGDTAEVLVRAPFASGEGLATIARNGIRSTQRFTLTDGTAVLQVPIADADIPQLTVSVDVAGSAVRTAIDGSPQQDAPPTPASAQGILTLRVPPTGRSLQITATPQESELAPGASTSIDIAVADGAGAPVEGADVAVAIVDEAVLALTGYELADPLQSFYGGWYEQLSTTTSRQQINLRNLAATTQDGGAPATTAAAAGAGGLDTAGGAPTAAPAAERSAATVGSSAAQPVGVRTNFDAVALFEPSANTDASGHVTVEVTLPQSVTRYRVMVVAAAGTDRFGKTERDITTRLPLAVRPSPPRFANFGDHFELPVVVQNQTGADLDVDVVLQTANLPTDGAAGKRVHVPAAGRVEVRFPVTTDQAGAARYRVAAIDAAGEELADAAGGELPVYTPATAEAFATYGVIDGDPVAQPLLSPTDVVAQFGGLEIDTSSTALQALTDAVLYIDTYRYESSDALASRLIAFTSLKDVLAAFDAAGLPSAAQFDATIVADLAALTAMQNDDGGFPWWRRGDDSVPFDSIQAAHALQAAKAAGYAVPQMTIDRALAFLSDIQAHIPPEYGQQQRDSLRAYALWVRALAGQRDPVGAEALYRERGDNLSVEALAWLWSSIDERDTSAAIERTLGNRVVETAGAANFVTDYGDGAYLTMQSDRRTDGIALDALIAMRPDSDLIPKLVTGLLADRVAGRWNDIQQNTFVLVALKHYFATYETQTPDFVARLWLGPQYAGEHAFSGRQTDRARLDVPMSEVLAAGDSTLVVAKDGAGRLYYRIGLTYAPASLDLEPLDRGFVVGRTYAGVDDPTDVQRGDDGTWHVKAGARVRVTLTMVAESQRTHVALVDPLPAGFESLNPDLAVTQTTTTPGSEAGEPGPPRPLGYSWWGPWFQHQQLRDDRSEAFTTLLPAGTYTYSYVARATTPGRFIVPPARAEEMYAPETFGRSSSERVDIV